MAIVVRPSESRSRASWTRRSVSVSSERGRLVEDEDRRVAEDRARDRDPLLLAAREAVAALADDGVVAVRERGDDVVDPRSFGRGVELLVARGRLREAEVLAHRGMEEIRLLRDDPDEIRKRGEGEVSHVDAADRDGAAVDVVEPRCEVAERRLPGAGLADECRRRPGGHGEAHVLQRPGVVRVAEPDGVENDVARVGDLDRIFPLGDVNRCVEVLEDPVEERERGLDVEADAEQ